jgi:hypothetical protein
MNYQGKTGRKKPEAFSHLKASIWVKEDGAVTHTQMSNAAATPESTAKVYCPMCTHTVDATVEHHAKNVRVKRGQKCPRCSGRLDAGYIMYLERAA